MKKFMKWFELNVGWFFVNGFKEDDWHDYLNQKYKTKNNSYPGPTKL